MASETNHLQATDFLRYTVARIRAPTDQLVRDDVSPAAPFITPPMSIMLDLVRGCAAIAVLVGHAIALKIYTEPFPLSEMLQHNAVMVFFVLSGLVISSSLRRNRYSLSEYVVARAARILPVSVPALFFAAACFVTVLRLGYSNFDASGYPVLNARSFVMPFFFLSESEWGVGTVWDRPYWSLCYEESYYALFGCAMLLRGPRRILSCLIIAFIAGLKILLLAPVWLLGVALTYYGARVRLSLRSGIACLALVCASLPLITHYAWHGSAHALARMGRSVENMGQSQFFLTDYALGVMIALGFIALRPMAAKLYPMLQRAERPIRALAGFSFTLYLFHWPLFCFMRATGWTCGGNLPAFIGVLIAVIAASALLAQVTEHKRDAVRTLFMRWFGVTPRLTKLC